MSENRISAILPVPDQQQVLQALATVRQLMPFLMSVPFEEWQGLVKAGDKSVGFIHKCLDFAQLHSDVLPRSFDIAEMQKDVALLDALRPILSVVTEVHELLEGTCRIASSEAYAASLTVYSYAKQSDKAGIDDLVDDLGRRFVRKTRGKAGETPENPPTP